MEYLFYGVLAAVIIGRLADVFTRGKRAQKWVDKGAEALRKHEYAAAIHAFKRSLKLQPLWAPVRRLLARAYIAVRQFEEAEDELRRAVAFEPKNGEAYADLGVLLALRDGERTEEALSNLEEAVRLAPHLREQFAQAEMLAHLRETPRFQAIIAPPPPQSSSTAPG